MNHLTRCMKLGLAALAVAAVMFASGCAGPRSDPAPAVAGIENAQPRATAPPPALPPPPLPAPAAAKPIPAPEPTVAERPVAARPDSIAAGPARLACRSSADCVVKDVGSCCGYQPRCLNAKAETFPEQVREKCAREGRVGTCGFREIQGCECVQGKCAAIHDSGDDGVVR